MNARVWGEYVESEANIADEPSRQGVNTKFKDRGYDVHETPLPEINFMQGAALSELHKAFAPKSAKALPWKEYVT